MSDSRALLGEAIRDEKGLNCCARHPSTVWFDGKACPCCRLIWEMKVDVRGRKWMDSEAFQKWITRRLAVR